MCKYLTLDNEILYHWYVFFLYDRYNKKYTNVTFYEMISEFITILNVLHFILFIIQTTVQKLEYYVFIQF